MRNRVVMRRILLREVTKAGSRPLHASDDEIDSFDARNMEKLPLANSL